MPAQRLSLPPAVAAQLPHAAGVTSWRVPHPEFEGSRKLYGGWVEVPAARRAPAGLS